MLGFRGLRSSQKADTINREAYDLKQPTTSITSPEFSKSPTMSQTQNGDHVPNKNLQVNGNTQINGSHKVTTLRDATQRAVAMYRTEMGASSEQFLSSCNSVEIFFDFVAGIRLREMPHHSSRWDKVLKWAEFFAAQVYAYSQEVVQFADYSQQAAQIIWASSRSLLELGPSYIAVLEKAFGVFYSCGLTLGFFLRHEALLHSSEDLKLIMAACYTDLLRLVTGISVYYSRKQTSASFSSRSFDELFGRTVESFFVHSDRFTDTIWATRLESLAKPGDVSVDLVREFLTPHDRVTRMLAVTRYNKKPKADFTCEWFDRHLSDFTRGGKELMLVTGKQSTGKSVLSEWVVERLQASTGRRAWEVVTYTVGDSDLKTELTTISVVKGLLLQMLQLNVGDNSLYKSLATAYELSVKGAPTAQVEDALWKALEGGLRADRHQIIIIDGIDQLKGGESDGMRLLDRMHSIVSNHSKTKCIAFSRPFSELPSDNYAHFTIQPAQTSRDLSYFAESILPSNAWFDILSTTERRTIISNLVQRADGSFGWLLQAFEILKSEKTSESVLKRVESLPKTLTELIDLTVGSVDLKHRDTKSILAWMLAAERPLLVTEMKQLISIDISNCTRSPRPTRIEDDINQTCGSLIVQSDGFVRFKNTAIKQNLLDRATAVTDFKNTGAFPFHIKEAHYDLTIRCLAYIKIHVTRPTQPTLQPLNDYELDELFNSYDLLQYAARYWGFHFQASPMHEPTVQHKITSGFKTCFPSSTLLPLIEGSTYQYQYSINETIDFHLLTLSIRRLVLGDTTEPALQTILNLARTKQLILKSTEINEYYYQAWFLATTLKITTIATTCAHEYIEMTSSSSTTKNSDVVKHRTELLQYIIRIQRESKKSTLEIIIYMEMLVTLYITIGETEKAARYSREIYELNVTIYGRTAPETLKSYERLTTTLQKSTKTEEIHEITKTNYEEATRNLNVTDQKRISLTWQMIEYYERQKNYNKVEELLLGFWQSLSHTRYTKETAVQERKIDVALRYVEFLKQQKRTIEAENILQGIWADLSHHGHQSTAMVTRSKQVGDQLQSLGSLAAARSVFASLWAYYVRSGKTTSVEATSVNNALTQTTREITIDSHTETTYEISTLRQIFETTFITVTTKQVDTTTVKTAKTLIQTYYQRQEWHEVVKVARITIERLWPAFTSKDLNVSLPTSYQAETMEFLNRLSIAYLKLRQLDQVEAIYRRIFYAVKSTPNSPDDLLLSTSKTLIHFYEMHSMIEKTIFIYKDLSLEHEKRHGKTNSLTIKTLYTLGDVARQLNHTTDAEWAYHEIHTNLGPEICHQDAIRAALALCTIYEQQRRYPSAKNVYASLWQMFIKHGKDCGLKPDFAEELYQKYVRVLKQENKTEYPAYHQLAVDYRKALVRYFGLSHETTLKATMQLGELSEEHRDHREEAITMYEEADQKSRDLPKGQVSEPTMISIRTARSRLPTLYSTSKLAHSPRAIELYNGELQTNHSKHGHASQSSITWLSLIAIALAKQGNQESTTKAQDTVKNSVIEILKNEKNSHRLYDSGGLLAHVYLKAGLKTDAEQLVKQLRNQIIFGDSDINKSLNLASGTKLDKRTWVFLVSFETTLHGKREIYSWEMANLVNTVFMYGAYTHAVSQKSPFLPTLVYGSRLLQFTKDIGDETTSSRVETELLHYFSANLKASSTINTTVLRDFFHTVLVEVHSDADVSVLRAGLETVQASVSKGKFQDAYELGLLVDHFQQFQGGYNNLEKIGLGLQLAILLGGRGKMQPDQKLRASMLEVSGTIMKQIMKFIRTSHISLIEIPINELNLACGLLGDQQNLDDLEWILTQLWNARHFQKAWSSAVVVSIGRRLVETQFTRGHHDEAIHLCEDMCYNLRRVWGALDATTIEMHGLLSAFYTSVGNYRRAMLVHEDLLRDTVSDKGEELPAAEAAQIAVQQLELLKRAYQRLGGWDKDPQTYVDLYQQLSHVFGSEDSWKKAQMQSVEKWQPKGADNLGTWIKPESFEFMATGSRKHANHLRKSSGTWSLRGHFHAHRLSRTYSAKSIST